VGGLDVPGFDGEDDLLAFASVLVVEEKLVAASG